MNNLYVWLVAFSNEPSPIGDLARDVVADSSWPRAENDPRALYDYLEDMGASDAALSTFGDAYERYSGQPFDPLESDEDDDDE